MLLGFYSMDDWMDGYMQEEHLHFTGMEISCKQENVLVNAPFQLEMK